MLGVAPEPPWESLWRLELSLPLVSLLPSESLGAECLEPASAWRAPESLEPVLAAA